MRKIEKLVLTQISRSELAQRQMNHLKGGSNTCQCSCYHANNGGSSSADNRSENHKYGYDSKDGCNDYWQTDSGYGYDPNS